MADLHDDIALYLNFVIEFVEKDNSVETLGKRCIEISRHYQALGICELLEGRDIDEFYHLLIRSAQTRKYFLDRCHQQNHIGDPYMAVSFNGPFFDAIAANQFQLAESIARLSPTNWRDRDEYEDDFAYTHFLHQILLRGDQHRNECQQILEQFEASLEGAQSPRLDFCKSFMERDQDKFDNAFETLLLSRKTEIDIDRKTAVAEELSFEPGSSIFIEGLALLKFAERLGLSTEDEYPMCPSLARRTDYRQFEPYTFPGVPV